ncbi:hypothetical protein E2562_003526 [Oryza meyeriana var. granulata]|uniref:Uncharacterized protein n=1 Tax=Oryza meyeriana var. granulata TaxID=110450 RepID=A0A6G1CM65_9ORYZ|nr:hypothetical protein E2562_003526 [Oryza meyeriana var. granulata]
MYLRADDDGSGVSLHPVRTSVHAAWAVHMYHHNSGDILMLHNAANGRYLAATTSAWAPRNNVTLSDLNLLPSVIVGWFAIRSEYGDDVLLRHTSERFLRAQQRRNPFSDGVGVRVDVFGIPSTMRHWVVETIPQRNSIPRLPIPSIAANCVSSVLLYAILCSVLAIVLPPRFFSSCSSAFALLQDAVLRTVLENGEITIAALSYYSSSEISSVCTSSGGLGERVASGDVIEQEEAPPVSGQERIRPSFKLPALAPRAPNRNSHREHPAPPPLSPEAIQSMEQFPDRQNVWLRSRVHGTYLHADDDGSGVSLRPHRASLTAAWTVHLDSGNPRQRLLLHSAAYGRYLLATARPAPGGLRGRRVELGVYDWLFEDSVVWMAIRSGSGDDVWLRHVNGRYLRANGRHRHWNSAGVSADSFDRSSTMLHWVVEHIPPRDSIPSPPRLPRELQEAQPQTYNRRLFQHVLRLVRPEPARTIRFVWIFRRGVMNVVHRGEFKFIGRSLFTLKNELADRLGIHIFVHLAMCVKAGRYGRETPLAIDLPRSNDTLDIVLLTTGEYSPYSMLQHPDVHAAKRETGAELLTATSPFVAS